MLESVLLKWLTTTLPFFGSVTIGLLNNLGTSTLFSSGVELSGSGLRILRANAEQAELEKDIMDYNAKINQARTFEQANFARMQGQVARNNARAAELGYYAQAGESLLRAYG